MTGRKQLEHDLNRFAYRFRGRLEDASGTDIDGWLRDLGVGPRTRNTLRNSVQALFTFAFSRRYLPKDHDELDSVPVAKDGDGEIEIFTPAEMEEKLAVATPAQIPFLAIVMAKLIDPVVSLEHHGLLERMNEQYVLV